MYRSNFLKLRSWFKIPDFISNASQSLFTYVGLMDPEDGSISRKTVMGATPEIQEDIVYDFVLKRQRNIQQMNQVCLYIDNVNSTI